MRALYAFVIVLSGGSEAASGRKSAFARGANERVPRMGCAKFASSSTGRLDLTFEGGRSVSYERGITLGGRRVHRLLCESGALYLSREENVGQSRPAAGSVRYGASRALKLQGPRPNFAPRPTQSPGAGRLYISPPAPAPVQAPAAFNAPDSPRSMNFPHPEPRFFVYSPLEHCSFDT